MVNYHIGLRAKVCSGRKIFENMQAAAVSQSAARLSYFVTLCRPDSKNGKTRLKLGFLERLKNRKLGIRQPFDSHFELGFDLCFQQRCQGGGHLAEERRQKAVARSALIAGIAVIARDRKKRDLTTDLTRITLIGKEQETLKSAPTWNELG